MRADRPLQHEKQNMALFQMVLGASLNLVINASLIYFGFGSISTLVKSAGKAAAKKVIKETVIVAIKSKLKNIGLKKAASIVGGLTANTLINAAINPGGWVADWLDGQDKMPSNGYQEWW